MLATLAELLSGKALLRRELDLRRVTQQHPSYRRNSGKSHNRSTGDFSALNTLVGNGRPETTFEENRSRFPKNLCDFPGKGYISYLTTAIYEERGRGKSICPIVFFGASARYPHEAFLALFEHWMAPEKRLIAFQGKAGYYLERTFEDG